MTGLGKWLFCMFLLSTVVRVQAQTINAATCSSTDVQNALNSVSSDGTMVGVPAGNCTWTTTVTYNQIYSTTIQGQTACSGTPASSCTDNTIITSNMGSDVPALAITTASGKSLRLTGFTFALTGATTYSGMIHVDGNSQAFRTDHVHFKFINADAINVGGFVLGVIDHSIFDLTPDSTNDGFRATQDHWNNVSYDPNQWAGDGSWNDATTLGSNRFLFVEDSTFNGGNISGGSTFPFTNDCYGGGRFVLRHNVINHGAHLNEHGTGHGDRDRGCRAWEVYQNTWGGGNDQGLGSAVPEVHYMTSGTGVMWGNNVTGSYRSFIGAHINREDNATYSQAATPNGWGYCGTAVNGTGSNWDQNRNSSTGYGCLDQIGRGVGDLLIHYWPNVTNSTTGCLPSQTCAWPRQALEPVYTWENSWVCPAGWCGTGSFWANADPGLNANRDYFTAEDATTAAAITTCPATPSGNCTAGVGVGTMANRPTSCSPNATAYPAGNSPGVGYWATDVANPKDEAHPGALYRCTATNTWTLYYQPYTYPHPLTGAPATTGTSPSPPSNLAATVQ